MTEKKKPDTREPKRERPSRDFEEERGKMGRVPRKKEPSTVVDTLPPPPPPQTPKSDED